MQHYERVWTFSTDRFLIELSFAPCDDLDLSWDESGETRANLESGLWEAFDSRVRVFVDGVEIGCDYLSGSIYENPRDFINEKGGYFHDMVRQAIKEARFTVRNLGQVKLRH